MTNSNLGPTAEPVKPKIIFVLGAPGVGKGTLCTRLAESGLGYHLSTGDYLRQLNDSEPIPAALGGLTKTDLDSYVTEQKLVPAAAIVDILGYKLNIESKVTNLPFLVDGFPRHDASAELFEQEVGKPTSILFFDCSKDTAKYRFLRRGRGNDNAAVFEKRYAEFEEKNKPIIKRYQDITHRIYTGVGFDEAYNNLVAFFASLECNGNDG